METRSGPPLLIVFYAVVLATEVTVSVFLLAIKHLRCTSPLSGEAAEYAAAGYHINKDRRNALTQRLFMPLQTYNERGGVQPPANGHR